VDLGCGGLAAAVNTEAKYFLLRCAFETLGGIRMEYRVKSTDDAHIE
jgi:hypothetical protein